MLNGTQFAEKWGRRLKAAGQDISTGVDSVTQAPGIKAAKKADKMLAGIQEAIRTGKWQRAVQSVTLDDWKTAMKTKGIPRISAGVDGAMPHMAVMGDKLMNAIGTVKAKVDQMADNTFEERLAKMNAFITEMHKVKLT